MVFRFLDIPAVGGQEESDDPQSSDKVEKQGKRERQEFRQGEIRLGNDHDYEGNQKTVKDEQMHRAGIRIPEHPLMPHHIGPEGFQPFLGLIGPLIGFTHHPEPVAAVKSIGKHNRHYQEEEEIE